MEIDHDLEKITPNNLSTLTFGGTGGIIVPSGSSATRPSGVAGALRYNTDTGVVETFHSTTAGYIGLTDVFTIRSSVAATGTSLATATGLLPGMTVITASTPVTAIGVAVPNGVVGMKVTVINSSANTISIFPQASHNIDGAGTGIAVSLIAGGMLEFVCNTSTSWITNRKSIQDLSYANGTLPVANGGSGVTTLGTPLQVLRTNSAATATEWATISSSGGSGLTTGSATIDCNLGALQASTFISAPTITTTSVINVQKSITSSANKSADEHLIETWEVMAGGIINASGFYIYAKCTNSSGISGLFNVTYSY